MDLQTAIEHYRSGRFDAAVAICADRLRQEPADVDALNILALSRLGAGDTPGAVEALRRAAGLRPASPPLRENLGRALLKSGLPAEAAAEFQAALALAPSTNGWRGLAEARTALGDGAGALAAFDGLLALDPADVMALNNAGVLALQAGDAGRGAALLERAADLAPSDPAILAALLQARLARGDRPGALVDGARRLAELEPHLPAHWSRLGALLGGDGQFEAALAAYGRALALDDGDVELWAGYAKVADSLDRLEPARQAMDRALVLAPDRLDLRTYAASVLVRHGRLDDSWAVLDGAWRRQPEFRAVADVVAAPEWLGQPLANGRVLLHSGRSRRGDHIQNLRYARRLSDLGATVVYLLAGESDQGCRRLFRTAAGVSELVASPEAAGRIDYHCYVDVGGVLTPVARTLDDMRIDRPYLAAEPALVAAWAAEIAGRAAGALRVGLVWRASATHWGAVRWLPAAALARLLERAGGSARPIAWFALQHEVDGAEAALLAGHGVHVLGPGLDRTDAFVDTAAVMANLDLVISVDTACLHLAGALGRPTWGLLNAWADPRWFIGRSDTPLYPTMRLYRQAAITADWSAVVDAVVGDLADQAIAR